MSMRILLRRNPDPRGRRQGYHQRPAPLANGHPPLHDCWLSLKTRVIVRHLTRLHASLPFQQRSSKSRVQARHHTPR